MTYYNKVTGTYDLVMWDADTVAVECHEFTVINSDGDERDGVRLTLTDIDSGNVMTIFGDYEEALQDLARRITEAAARPNVAE